MVNLSDVRSHLVYHFAKRMANNISDVNICIINRTIGKCEMLAPCYDELALGSRRHGNTSN